jgi:hypothetical protein
MTRSEIQRFVDRFVGSAQIELADSKSIEGSLRNLSVGRPPRSRMRNTSRMGPVGGSQRPARRCRCGNCLACQDNARWERIFQEKFADPDYYKRRLQRRDSSLNWL